MKRIHGRRPGRPRHRPAATGTRAGLWSNPRSPGSWSDTEYQLRNWLYYTWLSGDHICRAARPQPRRGQLGHAGPPRRRAYGDGGPPGPYRSRCGATPTTTTPWTTTYPGGIKHTPEPCAARSTAAPTATCPRPSSAPRGRSTMGNSGSLRLDPAQGGQGQPDPGPRHRAEVDPYQQEHIDMIDSIRAGKPLNELRHRGREHPDGHHGADVDLHGPDGHLGTGAQLQARPDAQGRSNSVPMPTPGRRGPGRYPASSDRPQHIWIGPRRRIGPLAPEPRGVFGPCGVKLCLRA